MTNTFFQNSFIEYHIVENWDHKHQSEFIVRIEKKEHFSCRILVLQIFIISLQKLKKKCSTNLTM